MPSSSSSVPNRPRSSARSIASWGVPRMRMPAASSSWAMRSGVWPPNCTITPFGGSFAQMLATSSKVSGSK